ncbi:DivIVA domain-containing protein [Umezawaea beigongshangensis]|uniref:DivIVA domain-containing protein n=1 Tax=Umezawaea beigongshangensis TaxID=2780383 RepID=UPI003F686CAB
MQWAGHDTQQRQPAHPAPLLSAQDVQAVAFHQPVPGQLGYDADQVDLFIDRVEATMRSQDVLTAEDVRRVRFSEPPPGAAGYLADEVDTFLDLVADTLRSTPQRRQAVAPAQGAHATSSALRPPPRLTPEDVRAVRFHKPRPGNRGYHEGEIDAFLERIEATLRGRDDLTALQVQEIEFSWAGKGQIGYDEDDVDTFLDLVVVTLERTPPTPARPKPKSPPLTAREVRAVAFSKPPRGRRGYLETQVDKFLDRIADTLLGQDDLTPDDVRNVMFSRPLIGRRGYHEGEVDTFLSRVEEHLRGELARKEKAVARATRPPLPRVPQVSSWKELRALKLPSAGPNERGYRVAQVDRLLEEIGISLDGMLGATAAEVQGTKFALSLLNGQGYERRFVDQLVPQLVSELRRRGR